MSHFGCMLLNNGAGVLVPAYPRKLGMSMMTRFGPFKEFDPGHDLGPDPNAFLHISRG